MSTMLAPAHGVDLPTCIRNWGRLSNRLGVEKDPMDLARYESIIAETRPDVIVETGTRGGFSAAWFATQVDQVITIDVDPSQVHPFATEDPAWGRVRLVPGNSTDPAVFAFVAGMTMGRRVMVSLDSDHSYRHVRDEIDLYAGLVTPGCYLVVEDGIYHFHNSHEYDGDPLQAISATLPFRGDFVRDIKVEGRFLVTGAVAGWWRRTEVAL